MINTIQIALSGMIASSKKVEASAANIANMSSAGSLEDPEAPPYSARETVQSSDKNGGVRSEAVSKNPPFTPAYSPDSPFADDQGLVGAPNVDLAGEAVNLKLAEHSYKANIATLRTADDMQDELLRLLDEKA